MPEIPDLNIFKNNLAKRLVGKKLNTLNVLVARKLKVPEALLKESLEGQTLERIDRIGKELHLTFSNNHVLSIHLMLYGAMHWYEGNNDNKFTIAELEFTDGVGLALTDWQKSLTLSLDPKPAKVPDAMSMPVDYLYSALKAASRHIKTVLTDGKVVLGIGNAYVDEILYEAKISPFSKANKIPGQKIDALTTAIHTLLTEAERHIAKMYPDTITEKERDFLKVHRPKQELTLAGEPILKADLDSRKTYYTAIQELFE